jgi:pantoate--beta-alanine ligase
MSPAGAATTISPGGVARTFEGERRPGHFDGVATIVAKLFNIVQADLAVFGLKDAQQCAVIAQLVRDLDIPVRLVWGETLREDDGLAMSSRNAYLSAEDRAKAPVLQRALRAGVEAIGRGAHDAAVVGQVMAGVVAGEEGVTVDYLAVIDPVTFETPESFDRDLLVAGAVRIGKTRLIDNLRIPR